MQLCSYFKGALLHFSSCSSKVLIEINNCADRQLVYTHDKFQNIELYILIKNLKCN